MASIISSTSSVRPTDLLDTLPKGEDVASHSTYLRQLISDVYAKKGDMLRPATIKSLDESDKTFLHRSHAILKGKIKEMDEAPETEEYNGLKKLQLLKIFFLYSRLDLMRYSGHYQALKAKDKYDELHSQLETFVSLQVVQEFVSKFFSNPAGFEVGKALVEVTIKDRFNVRQIQNSYDVLSSAIDREVEDWYLITREPNSPNHTRLFTSRDNACYLVLHYLYGKAQARMDMELYSAIPAADSDRKPDLDNMALKVNTILELPRLKFWDESYWDENHCTISGTTIHFDVNKVTVLTNIENTFALNILLDLGVGSAPDSLFISEYMNHGLVEHLRVLLERGSPCSFAKLFATKSCIWKNARDMKVYGVDRLKASLDYIMLKKINPFFVNSLGHRISPVIALKTTQTEAPPYSQSPFFRYLNQTLPEYENDFLLTTKELVRTWFKHIPGLPEIVMQYFWSEKYNSAL